MAIEKDLKSAHTFDIEIVSKRLGEVIMLELMNGLDLVAAIMTIAALGFMAANHFIRSTISSADAVGSSFKRSLLNQIVIPRF